MNEPCRRPCFLAVVVFLVTSVSASTAVAQAQEEAFAYFERAAELYAAGDYRGAIVQFRNGYEIQPHPMFQVNIALAYWRLGALADAIAASEVAAAGADELGAQVATENSARRSVFTVITNSEDRAGAIAAEIAARAQAERVQPPPPERTPFRPLFWTGVGTAGIGGVLLVVWTVAEVGLADDARRLERAGELGDRAAFNTIGPEFRRKQKTARILLGSGLGLAAVGGGLITFDLVTRGDTQTAVALTLSDGPGLVIRHRF